MLEKRRGTVWGDSCPSQPIEVWAREAGMDWAIRETPVRYMAEAKESGAAGIYGQPMEFPELKVLYRSDTNAPFRSSAVATR